MSRFVFWLAFVPILGAIVFVEIALRCPRCKARLGLMPVAELMSKEKRFNFCPCCGISTDEPAEGQRQT